MELEPYLKLELKPLQWLNTSLRPQASISKFESPNLLQDSKEKKREKMMVVREERQGPFLANLPQPSTYI